MQSAEKLFDIVDVTCTDAERSAVIEVENKAYKIACEPAGLTVLDKPLWILSGSQLRWIYTVWPKAKEDEFFYSVWGTSFFSRFINYAKSAPVKLPMRGINLDRVAKKMEAGKQFDQLIKELTA